jgi:hypothetical protein
MEVYYDFRGNVKAQVPENSNFAFDELFLTEARSTQRFTEKE